MESEYSTLFANSANEEHWSIFLREEEGTKLFTPTANQTLSENRRCRQCEALHNDNISLSIPTRRYQCYIFRNKQNLLVSGKVKSSGHPSWALRWRMWQGYREGRHVRERQRSSILRSLPTFVLKFLINVSYGFEVMINIQQLCVLIKCFPVKMLLSNAYFYVLCMLWKRLINSESRPFSVSIHSLVGNFIRRQDNKREESFMRLLKECSQLLLIYRNDLCVNGES